MHRTGLEVAVHGQAPGGQFVVGPGAGGFQVHKALGGHGLGGGLQGGGEEVAVKRRVEQHQVQAARRGLLEGGHAVAALHAHGFDDEDIWDITAITAFFGLSNRMANVTGMLPNPEFYLLGRVPKTK